MSEKLIIFDGEVDRIMDRATAHDDPYFSSLSEDELKEVYKYTLAYSNLIKDRNTMYTDQVSWGEFILRQMISDMEYLKLSKLKTKYTLI